MNSKRGFTLIELLVVMAIIAILAAIVVPNVARWIDRARMTRAQAEIESIELALTKMLTDTGRSTVNQLFDPNAVATFAAGLYDAQTQDPPFPNPGIGLLNSFQFQRAQKLYTAVLYGLLRGGRDTLAAANTYSWRPGTNEGQINGVDITSGETIEYRDFVDNNVRKNLGTSYLGDLGLDPWGRQYEIFPGPWQRGSDNPNIFRIFALSDDESNLPGAANSNSDAYAVSGADFEEAAIGFPAPRDKVAFIYSTGQNTLSGQMIYAPFGPPNYYNPGDPSNYYQNADGLIGGGDDINNWDSGASWTRFYN